jgi:hypothetical protein
VIAVMVPMDDELADQGRCWSCKQWFLHDDYYFQLSLGLDCAPVVWNTCLGCTAQLVCKPV